MINTVKRNEKVLKKKSGNKNERERQPDCKGGSGAVLVHVRFPRTEVLAEILGQ